MTALLFVFLLGRPSSTCLRLKQGKGQPIREDGPQDGILQEGHADHGGLMILSASLCPRCYGPNWANWYVWIVLFVTLSYGAIGFYDDYLKIPRPGTAGVQGKMRLPGRDRRRRQIASGRLSESAAGAFLVVDGAVLQERRASARGVFVLLGSPRDRGSPARRQPDDVSTASPRAREIAAADLRAHRT